MRHHGAISSEELLLILIHLDRWAFIVLFRLSATVLSGKGEKWRQFNIVIAFQRPTTLLLS